MTFTRKFNGKAANSNQEPMVAVYTCPEHGEFDCEVRRDENGEAPDVILCPADVVEIGPSGLPLPNQGRCEKCGHYGMTHGEKKCHHVDEWEGNKSHPPDESYYCACDGYAKSCAQPAVWTPSASVGCRVRRVEVTRGKWEPPERRTYLDTRKLGEGQSMDEFKAERKKVWDERRRQTVKELLR